MSNSYANKQAKYSKYVVKNLSNKQVRIFGINIKPGVEFDLLSIPGISQNEIFSSVLKDDIGPRLRSTPPILTVTENTIDLITITLPDADYTLDPVYFDFGTIIFAGTLTATRNVIFPNYGSTDNNWIVRNTTNQFLNVKTLSGTGSLIQSGLSEVVFSDGANIQGLSANPSDVNTIGGFRAVADITARNAIATQFRKEGMYVYVQSSNEIYKLGSGLTNSDWLYAHDNSSVTNLAALVALNDAEYTERAEFTVLTLKDVFYLDKTSTLTADSITILNSLSSSSGASPGRWIRKMIHDPTWLKQASWFIDTVSGSDEASGLLISTPIKTYIELYRRWGSGWLLKDIDVIVTQTGDATDADLAVFNGVIDRSASLTVVGAYTVARSGTLTAFSPTVSSTNTQISITDTVGGVWTSYVDATARLHTPILFPSKNAIAVLDADAGAGQVSIQEPSTFPELGLGFATLAPGDTYTVPSLPKGPKLAIHIVANPVDTALDPTKLTSHLSIKYLKLRSTHVSSHSNRYAQYTGCMWTNTQVTVSTEFVIDIGNHNFTGCSIGSGMNGLWNNSVMIVTSCVFNNSDRIDLTFNTCSIRALSLRGTMRGLRFVRFNPQTAPVYCNGSGNWQIQQYSIFVLSTNILGSSTAPRIISMTQHAHTQVDSAALYAFPGGANFFNVEFSTTMFPSINGMGGVLTAVGSPCGTLAQYRAAPFNSNAVDYNSGSRIFQGAF